MALILRSNLFNPRSVTQQPSHNDTNTTRTTQQNFSPERPRGLLGSHGYVIPLIGSFLGQITNPRDTATLNRNRTINPAQAQHFLPYLELSDSAYETSGAPAGWQRLNINEVNGVPLHDENTGFDAAVFRNQRTGETAIAFRGSENPLRARNDWEDDALQLSNQVSPQLQQALTLSRAAAALFGNVSFTGHSLGGALAQAAALHVGRPAYTFNSLGLNPATQQLLAANIPENQYLIHNIAMPGDIVTDSDNAQDGDSFNNNSRLMGNTYYADDTGFRPWRMLNNPLTRHLLQPLREALQTAGGQSDDTNDTLDLAAWALQSLRRASA